MPPNKWTPEDREAMRIRYKFEHVDLLLSMGEPLKAKAYWDRKWTPEGLPYPDVLIAALNPKPVVATAPVTVDVTTAASNDAAFTEEIPVVTEPIIRVSPSGWPMETTGEIVRKCTNPRLVLLRIADGRRASMWNTGVRPWKVGAKVKVRLEKTEGDPIYRTF